MFTLLRHLFSRRPKAQEPKVRDSELADVSGTPAPGPKVRKLRPLTPEALRSLAQRSVKNVPLTGLEIMATRTKSRVVPTRRRYLMWLRKQQEPAHVGKKQLARQGL